MPKTHSPFHINGQQVEGRGRTAPVYNPATGEQTGSVSLASTAEVNDVVAVAKKAFTGWATTTPLRRARILNKFLRILEERTDELAAVITPSTARCSRMPRARSSAAWKWSSSPPPPRSCSRAK